MRKIELTKSFRRDYRKVLLNPRHRDLPSVVDRMMEWLAQDLVLELRFRDHHLAGEYRNHRECHLKADLLLIYRKPDPDTVIFVRLGSHSELFS